MPALRRLRRPRFGFTLIELIVVTVVLALLAALAAFGYRSLVENSRQESVRVTAVQVARTIAARSAADQVTSPVAVDASPWADDLPANTTVTAGAVDPNDGSRPVTVAADGYCVVATFGARVADTGTLSEVAADGSCSTGPEAPTNVTASLSGTTATVSFTVPESNPEGTTYTAYAVEDPTKSATGTSSPLTIAGLGSGQTYTFAVKATSPDGTESEPSTQSAAVSTSSLSPASWLTSGLALSWAASTGEVVVEHSLAGDFSDAKLLATLPAGSTSYSATGLPTSRTNHLRVRFPAQNRISNTLSFFLPTQNYVSNLRYDDYYSYGSRIYYKWNALTGANGYLVRGPSGVHTTSTFFDAGEGWNSSATVAPYLTIDGARVYGAAKTGTYDPYLK